MPLDSNSQGYDGLPWIRCVTGRHLGNRDQHTDGFHRGGAIQPKVNTLKIISLDSSLSIPPPRNPN